MSQKKKDKKNGIEKLCKVLDDYSFKELNPEDEKYLRTLRQRLDEKNQNKIVFKKIVHETEEPSDEDFLKPKVVIHERIEKKTAQLPEFKEVEAPIVIEKQKDLDLREEDLIDIKKVKSDIPEFIEVKPKAVKKEEKAKPEVVEEEFIPVESEETVEFLEDLEEEKEEIEFIKVEPRKKEIEEAEEISEWEPVDSREYLPKEELELKKEAEEIETEEIQESVKEDEGYDEKDKIIEVFKDIQCIDEETAIILYNNGYTDIESLKTANIKELTKIKGIKRKTAKEIKKELEEPEPETWELPTETEEKIIDETEKKEIIEEEPAEKKDEKISEFISVNETDYCSECGCAIDSEMIFCHKCGTKLTDKKESTEVDEDDFEKPTEIKNIKISATAEKEVTVEEVKKIHDEIPLEEKLKAFKDIKSIDMEIAIALYDNGYTSFDLLKNVDVNDLKKIKGIKRKTAKKIREEIDEKIIENARVKPIPIGESSEGIITKDQLEKEEDFEEEKQSLRPVELSRNKKWKPLEEDFEAPNEKIGEEIEKEIKEEVETEPEENWEPIEDEETLENIEKQLEKEEIESAKKIEIFKNIESIDEETAIILYNNGYTDIESLKTANIKELTKIKGIKRKTAKEIKKELEEPEPETWELPTETEEKEKKTNKKEEIGDFGKIQIFKGFKSIDDDAAVKLYDYGFTSIELLKLADFRELKKVKGLKRKKIKEIIKDIEELHAEDKIGQMVMSEEAEYFKDEEFFEEESKQLDTQIKDFEEKEDPTLDEELFIEEELIEDLSEEKIEEEVKELKDNNEFNKIPSIDKKIIDLLNENNIKTIQDLNDASIRDLTKIKGIRKKVAKQIKKELNEYIETTGINKTIPSIEKNPYINGDDFSEEDEWESFEETSKKAKKSPKKGVTHGDYILYKREITNKDGKKRLVRFFSKGEPEDAEPIKLPKGYEIKENKKTGVPYLKKKK